MNASAPGAADRILIAPFTDKAELGRLIADRWGADLLVMGGMRYSSETLNAFVAHDPEGTLLGFVTYVTRGPAVCILSLDSMARGGGVGGKLIDAVADEARAAHIRTLRVMTTNDNTNALIYYQRRGFQLTALYVGAIDAYRAMNPALRPVGFNGIPVRDSLELELVL